MTECEEYWKTLWRNEVQLTKEYMVKYYSLLKEKNEIEEELKALKEKENESNNSSIQ